MFSWKGKQVGFVCCISKQKNKTVEEDEGRLCESESDTSRDGGWTLMSTESTSRLTADH